jgi:hypothetical protein
LPDDRTGDLEKYEKDAKAWYEARKGALTEAFYVWADENPEVHKDSDFTSLVDRLAAIWREERIPAI